MKNPFQDIAYDNSIDLQLIEAILDGSKSSLETLVLRHQHYIYNIAMKMMLSPSDAEDLTQEILIKVITKLAQFKGKSNFRTWLYRIATNHLLKAKESGLEKYIASFETYGRQLDHIKDHSLSAEETIEKKELIKEAKLSCLSGMLLCLNRSQRMVYILGEIFEADHNIGSELLDISKANFRKRLERARKDLYQFMNQKCGLINRDNPCRCAKKTTGFIKAGWVDKEKMRYNAHYLKSIHDVLHDKSQQLDDLI
ncbi:MAG: RNA polymerase sigma factor, partial [Bacteroidota bacterium]